MDQIKHMFVEVEGGLRIHVADTGAASDKVLLFLHGFPEIWYSWRHQMISLSKSGYRAIAVDYRGYGLSDPPPRTEDATYASLVGDLIAVLDSLDVPKVVLIGKDFGAYVASWFEVLHPEKVLGFVTLGIPFAVPGKGTSSSTSSFPEGFYVSRWREPGRAEADFGRLDAKTVVRNVYILFSGSELPTAAENQEVMDLVDPSTPLPPWFSEEDLEAYGALYQKSGFQTALKMPYRSIDEQLEVPLSEVRVNIPALLIVGGKDYVLKMPGMEYYINNMVKEIVPDLKTVHLAEGTHFVQEQLPEEVNQLILDFLKARIWP
ncbi:unnamed protein product [Linum tenue]|uniref:AB hydrolase-1 domain-containing protein n=1 Tax=Linum tenue TaxID=586396 RepID=A0AAV0PCT6_9ROSI|nr:unnamed protein product [Linum tenue]